MKIQVGVVYGGKSVEHEVSVISALQAMKSFDHNKYEIIPIYYGKDQQFYTGRKEMEAATQFFNEHFTENISVEDYALSRHMSTCWFIRSFKRYNGVTPMQYIVNLRITNAKTLLRTTTYSVSEVAAVVGYENPLYFSRLFKKQTGLPPSEFRNTSTNFRK